MTTYHTSSVRRWPAPDDARRPPLFRAAAPLVDRTCIPHNNTHHSTPQAQPMYCDAEQLLSSDSLPDLARVPVTDAQLQCLCDTKDIGDGAAYYRFNADKAVAWYVLVVANVGHRTSTPGCTARQSRRQMRWQSYSAQTPCWRRGWSWWLPMCRQSALHGCAPSTGLMHTRTRRWPRRPMVAPNRPPSASRCVGG